MTARDVRTVDAIHQAKTLLEAWQAWRHDLDEGAGLVAWCHKDAAGCDVDGGCLTHRTDRALAQLDETRDALARPWVVDIEHTGDLL